MSKDEPKSTKQAINTVNAPLRIFTYILLSGALILGSCRKNEDIHNVSVDLPQQLIEAPGTIVDDMEATAGWSTNATMGLNTTEHKFGAGSIKLSSGAVTGNIRLDKDVNLSLNAGDLESHRLWIYSHTPASSYSQITIAFVCNDLSWDHYVQVNYQSIVSDNVAFKQDKWTQLGGKTVTVSAGTPDLTKVKHIRINIIRTTEPVEISFDELTVGNQVKPAVLFRFDDGNDTDYDLAYQYLRSKNMVGNSFINSHKIGTTGVLTDEQLKEMDKNGWFVGNHTANHIDPATATVEQYTADLQSCESYLTDLGIASGVKHIAFPHSILNTVSSAAFTAFGGLSGGAGGGNLGYQPMIYEGGFYPWFYSTYFPNYNETVESVKTYIDKMLSGKSMIILGFHRLVESGGPAEYQYSYADFCEIVDYLETVGCQTLTFDEWYKLNSEGITVDHK